MLAKSTAPDYLAGGGKVGAAVTAAGVRRPSRDSVSRVEYDQLAQPGTAAGSGAAGCVHPGELAGPPGERLTLQGVAPSPVSQPSGDPQPGSGRVAPVGSNHRPPFAGASGQACGSKYAESNAGVLCGGAQLMGKLTDAGRLAGEDGVKLTGRMTQSAGRSKDVVGRSAQPGTQQREPPVSFGGASARGARVRL